MASGPTRDRVVTPTCPQDYVCSFTPIHPRIITHTIGPWWHGAGGLAVAIVAVLAIASVLAYLIYWIADSRRDNRERKDLERERQHKLAIEEQRTIQADLAKGNPEMLAEIRKGSYR